MTRSELHKTYLLGLAYTVMVLGLGWNYESTFEHNRLARKLQTQDVSWEKQYNSLVRHKAILLPPPVQLKGK